MNEEKEYHEVFFKDDRNKRGTDNCKKRTNVKQVQHRLYQLQKRNGQAEEMHESPAEEEEVVDNKKYGNGKAKKVLKEQTFWVDQPVVDAKNGKNGKNGKKK